MLPRHFYRAFRCSDEPDRAVSGIYIIISRGVAVLPQNDLVERVGLEQVLGQAREAW